MANDVFYITVIFTTFLVLGAFLPFINNTFDEPSTDINVAEGYYEDTVEIMESNDVGAWDVIASMFKIFTFTWGDLPLLLDIILFIPRVIFGVLVYRLIRSGGG